MNGDKIRDRPILIDSVLSYFRFEIGCRLANPGNANLPIGDGTEAQNPNREIGVPRVRFRSRSLTFLRMHFSKLGQYHRLVFVDGFRPR
jgi:hypothetical protein